MPGARCRLTCQWYSERLFPTNDKKENDDMAKTRAAAVMAAAEKARRAELRVADAERVLAKAVKARDRADADYLALVQESIARRQTEPAATGGEVSALHAE